MIPIMQRFRRRVDRSEGTPSLAIDQVRSDGFGSMDRAKNHRSHEPAPATVTTGQSASFPKAPRPHILSLVERIIWDWP